MQDIRQSTNYAKYLKSQGWIVERLPAGKAGIKNTNYFIKKIPILGSVLKVQRPTQIDFEVIKRLEEKYKVFQTIIEPAFTSHKSLITNHGFKLSKNPYLPSKTIHLDLTRSQKEIYANFSKDCKYALRRGPHFVKASRGRGDFKIVEYSTLKELKKIHNAWRKSVNVSRFVPSLESLINLKKSFPNNTSIFLTSHNKFSNIIGGAIFTRSSHDYAYYWYGFTNNEGRTSLSQYSLLYQGILWAKLNGCKVFDFEGIYDERFPNKSWLGFTHFKKSFGGREIFYPGCYTRFRFPF